MGLAGGGERDGDGPGGQAGREPGRARARAVAPGGTSGPANPATPGGTDRSD